MDRQVVSSWLRNVLAPYGDSSRSYSDIITTLDSFPSLSPRTELYISNLGETSLLIQLKGTIPITFKSNTYNIPIEIWIPKNYPRECPIAYVTPTKDINVRKTQHVELDGFVVGNEYIQNWTKKWQSKNLLTFIQACQEAFAMQPPVYAKPKEVVSSGSNGVGNRASPTPQGNGSNPGASSSSSSGPSKPPPPLPQSQSPQPQSPAGPPRRPPKPGHQSERSASGDPYHNQGENQRSASGDYYKEGPSVRGHQQRQSSLSYYDQQQPAVRRDSYHQPPALPSHHQQHQSYAQPVPPPAQHHVYQQQHQAQQQQQPPQSPLHRQQPPHQQQGHHPGFPQQQHYTPHQHQHQHHQVAPPPALPPQHAQQRPHSVHYGANGHPIQQQQPPAAPRDLLDADDADEDQQTKLSIDTSSSSTSSSAPPPVRPPNPELFRLHMALHAKLSSRVSSMQSSLSTSNEHLRVLAKDLDAGPSAIEDELARLSAVREVCKTRAERLEATLESANRRRSELDARPQPPLSEIVLADSIVGEQLISLMSSDLALTDTLYHLSRALQSEQIDVDRYLKLVRLYGREQFLKRALARKIRLGLEGGPEA